MSNMITNHDYEEALKLKEEGKVAFSQKDYPKALQCYSKILLYIGMNPCMYVTKLADFQQSQQSQQPTCNTQQNPIEQQSNVLRLTTFSNMATVFHKQEQYEKCIENCDKVLQCDPKNVKTLYRRGSAYRNLHLFDLARQDLTKAQQLFLPGIDSSIENELKLVAKDELIGDDEFYKIMKRGMQKHQKLEKAKTNKDNNKNTNNNNNQSNNNNNNQNITNN